MQEVLYMHLIMGLGNPGSDYENTRHNIGRLAVCVFQKKSELPKFSENKKLASLVSEGKANKEKIILALPETMMNNSGKAASAVVKFYKIKPESIIVMHDDADIAFGKIKISFAKSSAGHRGVESVRRALKTEKFWRIRIGIQPLQKKHIPAMELVLKKFSAKDALNLKKILKTAAEAIACLVAEGGEQAMNKFN